MSRSRFPSLKVAAAMVFSISLSTSYAQTPYPYATQVEPNAFGASVEGINVQSLEQVTEFQPNSDTGTDDELTNLQGCAGVGQAEYTTGVFNMPEVFNKFKRDVNTDLAKQLLTYNYSLPQTAALFETLNTYGNQRYQQFLQGCSLDDLKKDARKQYLDACIKSVSSQSSTGGTGTTTATSGEKYARAWEICTAMYATEGQTSTQSVQEALTKRTETNKKFAALIRKTENVNKYIAPLVCASGNATTTTSTATDKCWPMLFIPQVSICNGKDLTNGCTGDDKYGVKQSPLPMRAVFDTLRTILGQEIVDKIVGKLNIDTTNLNFNTKTLAANNAVNALRQTGTATATTTTVEEAFKDFQTNYLNCTNKDSVNTLKEYVKQLNQLTSVEAQTPGNGSVTAPTFAQAQITPVTNKLNLGTPPNANADDLPKLAEIVLGCTLNQVVPMLDPVITAQLTVSCNADDRQAFYAVASQDVALAGTRDIYRYLSTKLKQVRARLQAEPLKAEQGTAAADAIDSPELRRRLASAITDVMLPAIESQLERLNELEKTRGQFAKRVESIYATKRGCVYVTGQGNQPTQ